MATLVVISVQGSSTWLVASMATSVLISVQGSERTFILKFSHAINLQGLELIYKYLSETLYYLERHAHSQMAQLALSIRISQIIRTHRE